jgi:4-amino-4-deoxy-L-arabinose transferase-like glycosyltransferase
MTNRLFVALVCVLFLVRLPSLAEPMGADQGLYAYVGDRILHGETPYRDAWDQKPPAVHFAYAMMRVAWPHESAVAGADLLAALATSALLLALGSAVYTRAVGQVAAVLFLFLSNPAFLRLSGVTVRAQSETFIAVVVTAALLLVARSRGHSATWTLVAAGVLLGLGSVFKYNAAVYVIVALLGVWLWSRLSLTAIVALAIGFCLPVAAMLAWFGSRHAVTDLYQATIAYNLRYSGETYAGPLHAVSYLLTFPIRHARVDALWLLGGAGCVVLLVTAIWKRDRLFPVAWVAAACASIAINGSRDLPQYFVQAAPAMALAAAWGGSVLWTRRSVVNAIAVIVLAVAVWRVNEFSNLAGNTWHDTRYLLGQIDRPTYLARYGDRLTRKYSALAVAELGELLRSRSTPADRVYVFGFSCGAYVAAERASASRFFWSRPVIVGFNEGAPGYGINGLLDDLTRTPPAIIALQIRDWVPDVDNSAHFFMTTPPLAAWLRDGYDQIDGPEGFDTWIRRSSVH